MKTKTSTTGKLNKAFNMNPLIQPPFALRGTRIRSRNEEKRRRHARTAEHSSLPSFAEGSESASAGYTLIELIAVAALIAITFSFALPRFQGSLLGENTKTGLRWILLQSQLLRQRAQLEQKVVSLHVNVDTNTFWITDQALKPEAGEQVAAEPYQLPEDMDVTDVELPDGEIRSSGESEIRFYANGYCDHLVIHLGSDNGDRHSVVFEPFLLEARVHDDIWRFGG